MKPVKLVLALFIAGAWNVASSGPVSAQSIGSIANQETERRKTIHGPAKVITNGDLKPAAPVAGSSAPAAAVPVRATPEYSTNTPSEAKYVAGEPSYWLNRMRELLRKRDRFRLQAAALRDRAYELTIGFDSTRDGLRRSTIESERQQLRTERSLVAADIAATDKEILDLEEEARHANVPPGWLRP